MERIDRRVLQTTADGRVCSFLNELLEHEKSVERLTNRSHLQCLCCGKQAYFKCTRCPGEPPMHLGIPDGKTNSCFLHYHNISSLGTWRGDWNLVPGQRRNQWQYPSAEALSESTRQMQRLHESIAEEKAAMLAASPPRAPTAPQFASRPPTTSSRSRRELALELERQQDPNPIVRENVV